jgi:hypothetical protein
MRCLSLQTGPGAAIHEQCGEIRKVEHARKSAILS